MKAHPGKTVLVVGHSASIPRMVNELGEKRLSKLRRYDDLLSVTVSGSAVKLMRLRYGAVR